jgi:hypothetical protein
LMVATIFCKFYGPEVQKGRERPAIGLAGETRSKCHHRSLGSREVLSFGKSFLGSSWWLSWFAYKMASQAPVLQAWSQLGDQSLGGDWIMKPWADQ